MTINSAVTPRGSDGRSLPAVQPVAGSVVGSPFTVGGTAVQTPPLDGPAIMLFATADIHVRFSTDGAEADATTMMVPGGQLITFPIGKNRILSMIQDAGPATVYVEQVATI